MDVLKAVPKTKIRINLPGRSALLREYIFLCTIRDLSAELYTLPEEVHFFPENFRFWNSLLVYIDVEVYSLSGGERERERLLAEIKSLVSGIWHVY